MNNVFKAEEINNNAMFQTITRIFKEFLGPQLIIMLCTPDKDLFFEP
jgi:hypothetical protein